MKKQTVSILLLIALIAPVTCIYGWLQIRKAVLRYEHKEKISGMSERDELVLLKFDKKSVGELRWERENEFEYEGKMYDVVESMEKEDSVYYLCWIDHEETRLIKRLETLAYYSYQHNTVPGKKQYRGIDLQKPVYLIESSIQSIQRTGNFQLIAVDYPHLYNSVLFKPPTPPPRKSKTSEPAIGDYSDGNFMINYL